MNKEVEKVISKWWLRGMAVLLATSPPAILLWFEKSLAPILATIPPVITIRGIAALLLTAFALLAYSLLQHPWLRWDEPTGTWVNRFSDLRYCGTCRANKIIVPLKNEITGWRCVSCGNFRTDPARKKTEPETPIIDRESKDRKREQIEKWRNMLLDVLAQSEDGDRSIQEILQRNRDYLDLEPHLSPESRTAAYGETTGIVVGSVMPIPLVTLGREIARLEKEWNV